MKIKLRDLTYEQYRKWYNNDCKKRCHECMFYKVCCNIDRDNCWVFDKDLFSDKFLEQEIEVEVEPILTDKEREYLSNIIKPFRDSVKYIERVYIETDEKLEFIRIGYNDDWFNLPYFEPGEYYENMELYKKYTLEELGL